MVRRVTKAAQRPKRIHLRGDSEAPGPDLVLALCGRIVPSRASLTPGEADESSLDPAFFCVKCAEARQREGDPF